MLGFLTRVSADYGDIVYYKLGSRKMYLLNNPEHIKDVLVTHNSNFEKSRAPKRAKIILGEGLWKMRLVPHRRIEPPPLITIHPKYGRNMILERR